MQLVRNYKTYFTTLANSHVTLHGNVAVGSEDLSAVFDGDLRTNLPDSSGWLFLIINPVIRPISYGNQLDAKWMAGFIILKNVPLRDSVNADIDTAFDEAMSVTADFILKMVSDSRAGISFWNSAFDALDEGKCDVETMPLLKVQDGSFVGYKVIFHVQLPFTNCSDFDSLSVKFT